MRLCRAGGLVLLAIAALLAAPLAAAMPPDQTSVAGIYDAADLDDLVKLVADPCAGDNERNLDLAPPFRLPEELSGFKEREYERSDSRVSARSPPPSLSPDVIPCSRPPQHPRQLFGPAIFSACWSITQVQDPLSTNICVVVCRLKREDGSITGSTTRPSRTSESRDFGYLASIVGEHGTC